MATALYAMAVNFDVTTQSGLRHLDDYLLTRYYISGYQPSLDDIAVYAALGHPPAPELVNLWRWYSQIHALLDNTFPGPAVGVVFTGVLQVDELPQDEEATASEAGSTTTSGPGSITASQTSNNDTSAGTEVRHCTDGNSSVRFLTIVHQLAQDQSASPNVDDGDYANGDLDHSGDHAHEGAQDELNTMAEDAEAALIRGRQQRNRSSVLLDVKPWDDETDMAKLEEAVRGVQVPGLRWGASKLVPVVGQINKLQIVMTIDDDLVSPDNLIEEKLTVEPANEHIQSCDIVAWNKL